MLPNSDDDTLPIVKQAQAAGVYVVTQWNKPADAKPADYDRWIAHVTYDGRASGRQIAEAMFKSLGGQGNVVALQGILATGAAKDRFAGLQEALKAYPGISLLEQQPADFDRTKAIGVTKALLAKYGDKINGVWTANDDMALGAVDALRSVGKTGKVAVVGIDAVPEAVAAVAGGTMTATVSSDGPWQGGIGLAMGFCAVTGNLDVATLPPPTGRSSPSSSSSPGTTPRAMRSRPSTPPSSTATRCSPASSARPDRIHTASSTTAATCLAIASAPRISPACRTGVISSDAAWFSTTLTWATTKHSASAADARRRRQTGGRTPPRGRVDHVQHRTWALGGSPGPTSSCHPRCSLGSQPRCPPAGVTSLHRQAATRCQIDPEPAWMTYKNGALTGDPHATALPVRR